MLAGSKYMIIALLATTFIVTGCRKDLCFEPYHPHERQLKVVIDYSMMDYVPNEMRLDFYSVSDGKHYMRFVTPTNDVVKLPYGEYQLVSFNDNSEFLELRDVDTYKKMLAYLPKISRSQYNALYEGKQLPYSAFSSRSSSDGETGTSNPPVGKTDVGTYTIGQPELLFVDSRDWVEVKDIDGTQEIRLRPANTTVVYHIRAEVTGMEYVSQARGTMNGVSPSMYLNNRQREWVNGTVMFDCRRSTDCITTSVTAFGMTCGGEQNPYMPEHNMLMFEFLLVDGSTYAVQIDIAHLLTEEICMYGGVIDLSGIVINIPRVSTGGFDATIDDWYDEETIKLQ